MYTQICKKMKYLGYNSSLAYNKIRISLGVLSHWVSVNVYTNLQKMKYLGYNSSLVYNKIRISLRVLSQWVYVNVYTNLQKLNYI